jgi:hypothetical protein
MAEFLPLLLVFRVAEIRASHLVPVASYPEDLHDIPQSSWANISIVP